MNIDASILVYKFHPERNCFNSTKYMQLQITFLRYNLAYEEIGVLSVEILCNNILVHS